MKTAFEWDWRKSVANLEKHGISFEEATEVFADPKRIILEDSKHSLKEKRFYCIGKTKMKGIIITRYTHRAGKIRIFGAGSWRKAKSIYAKENQ